jgi:hypothetical protein
MADAGRRLPRPRLPVERRARRRLAAHRPPSPPPPAPLSALWVFRGESGFMGRLYGRVGRSMARNSGCTVRADVLPEAHGRRREVQPAVDALGTAPTPRRVSGGERDAVA